MKTVVTYTTEKLKERLNVQNKNVSCEEMIKKIGGNTGNACFVDAIPNQIISDDEIWADSIKNYENKSNTTFVLVAANWINEYQDILRNILLPLEHKNVKLCAMGLGIQLSNEINTPKKLVQALPKETIKALKILGDKSETIGVRGEVTAYVLELLGIHNVEIIGCPSFYELYRKNWWLKSDKGTIERVACNIAPGEHAYKVLELSKQANSSIILQCMGDLPNTMYGAKIEQRHIDRKFPGLKWSIEELTQCIREKGRIFYNRIEWEDYFLSNDITFSYGNRFHGNMMAFTMGIPALWVIYDERVAEMVDAMKLPKINYMQLEKCTDIQELLEYCYYDNAFRNNYIRMSKKYVNFLNKNGISHVF